VQEGETLLDIAATYDMTLEQILAINPEVEPEFIQVGQILLIPAATPTPGPTATPDPNVPTPTPANYIVHVVSPGETLGSIAEEYDISVGLIRAANDLPNDDDTIRVNQSLVIPLGTPMPSPTPTSDPNATPTPIPPYAAPSLLSPPDGAVIVGSNTPILLQWASVSVLDNDEWYKLALSQPAGGTISTTVYTRVTSWRVSPDLLPADEGDAWEFQWQVQVVREVRGQTEESMYEEAGALSAVRSFTWRVPTPTPTPAGGTPSPTP
jgi:LysM repeat protein